MPTFDAKAPGSACSAIAIARSIDSRVPPATGVDCGAGGSAARFSRLTSGSVVPSKAISTPLSVMNSITSDE